MKQVVLSILRYNEADSLRLEEAARPFLSGVTPRMKGKSLARNTAFLAGRAALAFAFGRLGWSGQVKPDPDLGFLRALPSAGHPPIFANISHTRNIAVAAVANYPVGVDVEHKERSALKVLSRVATPDELIFAREGSLLVNDIPVSKAIALWSSKEAISKAVGLGITFGMQAFEIDLSVAAPYPVVIRQKGPMHVEDPAVLVHLFDDYLISVCTSKELLRSGLSVVVFAPDGRG